MRGIFADSRLTIAVSGSCWIDGLRMFAGGATASRTADDDEFMGTDRHLFDDIGRAVCGRATLSDGTALGQRRVFHRRR